MRSSAHATRCVSGLPHNIGRTLYESNGIAGEVGDGRAPRVSWIDAPSDFAGRSRLLVKACVTTQHRVKMKELPMNLLVLKGNRTTTGGYVLEGDKTIALEGHPVARDRDLASCGRCGKTGPIIGTGARFGVNNSRGVLDGDIVLCDCPRGTHRVIAPRSAGYDARRNPLSRCPGNYEELEDETLS